MENLNKFDGDSTIRMIFDMVYDYTRVKGGSSTYINFVCSPETGKALQNGHDVPGIEWIDDQTCSMLGCPINTCYRFPYGILGIMDFDSALPYDDSFHERAENSVLEDSALYKDLCLASPLPGRFMYDNHYFAHFFPTPDFYQPSGTIEYI